MGPEVEPDGQGGCQEGQSADGKGEAGINAGTKARLPFAFRKQFFCLTLRTSP